MFLANRNKDLFIISIIFAGLIFIVSSRESSATMAQGETAFARQVRAIDKLYEMSLSPLMPGNQPPSVTITTPAAGNHDYHTPGASGYFTYFGSAAGEVDQGYYSYDVGDWHIIVLNSQCAEVGGCDSDSAQGQWLQANLGPIRRSAL